MLRAFAKIQSAIDGRISERRLPKRSRGGPRESGRAIAIRVVGGSVAAFALILSFWMYFNYDQAAGGYQFLTKPAYQASISILLKQQSKKRLSTSAMETLSIIAYKQPISKTEIENIRGVNCDYAVQKLLDKGLIEITGKAETIGRPMLYGTTSKFMEYFGISDLVELPTPKDFTTEVNTIGENSESHSEPGSESKEPDAQV